MTATVEAPEIVTRHWETPVLIGSVGDLSSALHPDSEPVAGDSPFESLPVEVVLSDPEALRQMFRVSFDELADSLDLPAVTGVDLEIQVWRHGFDVPAAAHPADFVGWCVLASVPGQHSESGAIAFTDPRAGSAMTAMPGLPWGRPLLLNPAVGAHAAVPGWLIWSVVPVEHGQHIVVAVASSARK